MKKLDIFLLWNHSIQIWFTVEVCDQVGIIYTRGQMPKTGPAMVQLSSHSVVLHRQSVSNSAFSSVKGGNICPLSTFQSYCTMNWI